MPQAGYHWTTTTAYAVDDSTLNDLGRAANQYLRMGQARSVKQLLTVESTYLAIPTFNTVAADNTGHALYADVGNTPNVPKSLITACTPSGAAQLVYADAGVVTLDGSRSACAWQNDPGTPVPGIFNASHLPTRSVLIMSRTRTIPIGSPIRVHHSLLIPRSSVTSIRPRD